MVNKNNVYMFYTYFGRTNPICGPRGMFAMCYLQSVEAIGAELYLKNSKAIVDKRAPDVKVGWSTNQTRRDLGGYARGGAPI